MIKNYYKNIILYDFLIKIPIKNIFQIIKITKICLNINLKNINLKKINLINIFIFFKLILNQKIKITKSKKNNIFLKIKRNSIINCKITLYKNNIYNFLEKIIYIIIPNINNIKNKIIKKNIYNLKIINIFNFIEFKKEFYNNNNKYFIDILIYTNNINNYKKLILFFNYFYLYK
jgi:large subunit ribosomal protein L5